MIIFLLAGFFILFIIFIRRRGKPSNECGTCPRRAQSPQLNDRFSALKACKISVKRPINRQAYKVFVKIEEVLASDAPKARVLAEVGMGAFLSTAEGWEFCRHSKLAFTSFNAKRVDFLVIDALGHPAFVVEYQGSGHHLGGSAAYRDMLKREALRKAGIEMVEISVFHSDAEVSALLQGAVQRNLPQRRTRTPTSSIRTDVASPNAS